MLTNLTIDANYINLLKRDLDDKNKINLDRLKNILMDMYLIKRNLRKHSE